MSDSVDKLTRAASTERDKARDLRLAALAFAQPGDDADGQATELALQAAAKAWTNAYHARSRCEKHVREGK